MKRWLLVLSVAVNIVLAVGWYRYARKEEAQREAVPTEVSELRFKTNVVVRRQFVSWDELESSDYATYVSNLRAIGCPEQTVRDIIIADVNAHYARRLSLEVLTPDQQWWRSTPDTNILAVAEAKTKAIDDERRALLAQLLGPGWEGGDLINLPRPTQATLVLDGPVLGQLATSVKESVAEIAQHGQQRIQDYLAAQRAAGKEPDPVVLAKLDKQTQTDLAAVLTPPQLEEYTLRYSATADNLRSELGELKFFNATPEEFRRLFHAVEDVNSKMAAVSDTDPNAAQVRSALEGQRLNAIKAVLGNQRYADYIVLHDPMYRDAVSQADTVGNPQAASVIYEINRAAADEQYRITNNPALTAQQRQVELKQIELEQARANAILSGAPPVPEQAPPPPTATYTLSIGDNLTSISRRTGVPTSVIRQLNPNLDLSQIRPGDQILLPARQ